MSTSDDGWIELPFFAVTLFIAVASADWRFIVQWFKGIRSRDWATVSAVIDVVSVAEQIRETRHGARTIGYIGTLTYFYRNPELQSGDYCRSFSTESEAHAWVAPYKGRTVLVHVDPRDPSHSVLRKDAL